MKRTFAAKLTILVGALCAALVLTVYNPSPRGLSEFGVGPAQARPRPGTPSAQVASKHDLTKLEVVSQTLQKVADQYVDPSRIDPREMLLAALDHVQRNVAEILVEPSADKLEVTVQVNDRSQKFSLAGVDSPWQLHAKLREIFRFLQANMNPASDTAEVEYAAANGLLSTLDPHSVLLDPESAKDMDISTSAKFGGIGIEIGMRKSRLTVLRLISPTTPAAIAGLKSGDHIVKINSDPTANLTLQEAMNRLRGDPRTRVVVTIERRGLPGPLEVPILRDEIRVPAVEAHLLKGNVGYLKIKNFSQSTERDMERSMEELRRQGAKAWVVDLRGNPGGLLDQAIKVADLFLDAGTIVTTVGGKQREDKRARVGGTDIASPVVVLINSGSASASEIVAGALKNLNRAVVVGQTSFGKGSVQVLFDNDDGSKLKLTIAQYLTPGDVSIQSVGITPDIELVPVRIPDQLRGPKDSIHLLKSTHIMREADLDAHLTSKNTRQGDKPSDVVKYLYALPPGLDKTAPDEEQALAPPPDGDEEPAPGEDLPEPPLDRFWEDFEIQFARDLASQVPAARRTDMLAKARPYLARRASEEDGRITAALQKLGIDWATSARAGAPKLAATLTTDRPGNKVAAGDTVRITGVVTNTGDGPAYRVHARLESEDYTFEERELVFGKIEAGGSRTFDLQVKVPISASTRMNQIGLEFTEAHGAPVAVQPLKLAVEGLPRPLFAYGYQLIDERGNGDGLPQAGESFRLHVTVRNIGAGKSLHTTAMLRNVSGDGVVVNKGRFELEQGLQPGEAKTLDFTFDVDKQFASPELAIELSVMDVDLLESVREKLKFDMHAGGASPEAASGLVRVTRKGGAPVLEGASESAPAVGTARKGATLKVTGRLGSWVRVELESGRPGFVPSTAVQAASGSPSAGAFEPAWQVTPPRVAVQVPALEVAGERWKLQGTVEDDNHIEDVFVIVWNREAKIEGRKVFYRSNRGGRNPNRLDFAGEIPLWPGANMVTIVARENDEVRSTQTVFLYRAGGKPATAAAAPAPAR